MNKTLFRMTLLILPMIMLISCSDGSESIATISPIQSQIITSSPAETVVPTPSATTIITSVPNTPEPTPQSTVVPTQIPSPVPTNIPTQQPTPSPTQNTHPQKVEITHTTLSKTTDGPTLEINTAITTNYSGSITLNIFFNGAIDQSIIDYIYIDNSLIDPSILIISPNFVTVDLINGMPEYFTFKVKASKETDNTGISEDYSIDFHHAPPLTCEIALASPLASIFLNPPILLSQSNHDFMVSFNKPVNMDSLIFPDFMSEMDINVTPMSDRHFIITVGNLSLTDLRIGIEYIEGEDQSFNNVLHYDRFANMPLECIYRFGVNKPQKLYSVTPDTAELEVLHEFEFGTIFEDISPNGQYLSLGTVISDEDGYQYAQSIFDTTRLESSLLDMLISDSISTVLGAEITTYATGLYNPMVENEYWDNDNNYHFFFGNSIYDIDPVDLKAKLRYSALETSRYPYPVFHLENDEIAVIQRTGIPNQNYSLMVTQYGEYQLPIRSKHGEGWIHYEAHIADLGNEKLLVSGYEFAEGEENLMSTYILDLNDSSLSLLVKGNTFIGYYKEPGYLIYSKYNSHSISAISIDGQTLATIALESSAGFNDFIYDHDKNCFYIKQYNKNANEYYIVKLDAVTFELTTTQISFKRDFHLIGVTNSGDLLILEMI